MSSSCSVQCCRGEGGAAACTAVVYPLLRVHSPSWQNKPTKKGNQWDFYSSWTSLTLQHWQRQCWLSWFSAENRELKTPVVTAHRSSMDSVGPYWPLTPEGCDTQGNVLGRATLETLSIRGQTKENIIISCVFSVWNMIHVMYIYRTFFFSSQINLEATQHWQFSLFPDLYNAVVFPSRPSYIGLVLTAKTSLHYGGVCVCERASVWVCVQRR